MFVTHSTFKHSIQLDAESTLWTSIELALQWPWYIATVLSTEAGAPRTFMIGRSGDLLTFVEQAPLGRLVALQLLIPSKRVGKGAWKSVPLAQVERCHEESGAAPYAVVTGFDGTKYGGLPIAPLRGGKRRLVHLIDLPRGESS